MLKTATSTPAITVNYAGMTATCPNNNCDFVTNDDSVPIVLTGIFTDNILDLTISTTSLVFTKSDVTIFVGGPELVY
jgi:hypothetical protein